MGLQVHLPQLAPCLEVEQGHPGRQVTDGLAHAEHVLGPLHVLDETGGPEAGEPHHHPMVVQDLQAAAPSQGHAGAVDPVQVHHLQALPRTGVADHDVSVHGSEVHPMAANDAVVRLLHIDLHPSALAREADRVTLHAARHPKVVAHEEGKVGVRVMRLGGGHLAVVGVRREPFPQGLAQDVPLFLDVPVAVDLHHHVQAGADHRQVAVGERADVMEIIEAGEREVAFLPESGRAVDQNFGLGADV